MRLGLIGALAAAAALSLGAAPALGLERVRRTLDEVGRDLAELEKTHLDPALFRRRQSLTARLSDGQLFYLMREYERAAMVLLDVVEDQSNRSHPAWRDALYYLAESLYELRNYRPARTLFEQVLEHGTSAHQQRAIARLLEIALRTDDPAAASAYLARAAQIAARDPEPALLYAIGKYHYRAGDAAQALGYFQRVPAGHALHAQSLYFTGVALVRLGRLDEALTAFQAAAQPVAAPEGDAVDREAAEIGGLAGLAIARIYYEQGRLGDAATAYAQVPRDAKAFDDALFESVWISIKEEDYERALRKLEILLISQPDVIRGPDARLLQGKLLLMLGRHADATLAFQEVLFEFAPLQAEMQGVVKENRGDLEGHFNRLIGRNLASFDLTSFLPARAAEFAGPDADADRALVLVSELAGEKRDLDEAQRTIERLEVVLQSPARIRIFSHLQDAWYRVTTDRAALAEARGVLLDASVPVALASDPEYQALRDIRRRLGERHAQTPRSLVDLQGRDRRLGETMDRIEAEAFKSSIDIRGLEAQLAAIDKYVRDVSAAHGDGGGEEAVRRQVDRENEATEALRADYQALARLIDAERLQMGVNDYAGAEDDRLRARYLAAIEAEERWLEGRGVAAPPERARIAELDARAAELIRRATALVDEQVAGFLVQVARERANLSGYAGELGAYQGETEAIGGRIAARSFTHVLGRIDDVVLEADVGLVDIAWKQKQDQTDQIADMRDRQRERLEALERGFKEVSGD